MAKAWSPFALSCLGEPLGLATLHLTQPPALSQPQRRSSFPSWRKFRNSVGGELISGAYPTVPGTNLGMSGASCLWAEELSLTLKGRRCTGI